MRALLVLLGVFMAGPARAGEAELGALLAPSGTLRAYFIRPNLAQGRVDAVTGRVTGVVAEVAAALAARAGAKVSLVPVQTAAEVLAAVRSGAAEIGFVAPNAERTGVVLYSQTYMLVAQSALVRDDSGFASVSELDRAGVVVGVNTGDSVGVWLRGQLREARLRETPDTALRDAVRWFAEGSIQAFAGNRERLRDATRGDAGLHLLADDFYEVPQTVAVATDRADRLAAVDAALDEMRAQGLLERAVRGSGVEGVRVAPGR